MSRNKQNKLNVRRGDQVQVISGNYKGVRGQVLRAIPSKDQVVVEGVNMRKRHQAPSQANPEGGIVTFEAPINVSNVMLIDPSNAERNWVEVVGVVGDVRPEMVWAVTDDLVQVYTPMLQSGGGGSEEDLHQPDGGSG